MVDAPVIQAPATSSPRVECARPANVCPVAALEAIAVPRAGAAAVPASATPGRQPARRVESKMSIAAISPAASGSPVRRDPTEVPRASTSPWMPALRSSSTADRAADWIWPATEARTVAPPAAADSAATGDPIRTTFACTRTQEASMPAISTRDPVAKSAGAAIRDRSAARDSSASPTPIPMWAPPAATLTLGASTPAHPSTLATAWVKETLAGCWDRIAAPAPAT